MNKFYGKVGYAIEEETAPGVWTDSVVERTYYGDLIRDTTSKWQTNSNSVNDDLTISNNISIMADAFAYENFATMKYVEFMGVKWKINSVEIKRPRLLLILGGKYNGQTA